MALTNKDRVNRGLEHLRDGLGPFVDRMMQQAKGRAWVHEFNDSQRLHRNPDGTLHLDNAAPLNAMNRYWGEVFSIVLGRTERTLLDPVAEEVYQHLTTLPAPGRGSWWRSTPRFRPAWPSPSSASSMRTARR